MQSNKCCLYKKRGLRLEQPQPKEFIRVYENCGITIGLDLAVLELLVHYRELLVKSGPELVYQGTFSVVEIEPSFGTDIVRAVRIAILILNLSVARDREIANLNDIPAEVIMI